MEKFKIGDLRILPKGTPIRSLSLHEMITFENDVVIGIEAMEGSRFLCKLKMVFHNQPGSVPTAIDKANGSPGTVDGSKTLPYKLNTHEDNLISRNKE